MEYLILTDSEWEIFFIAVFQIYTNKTQVTLITDNLYNSNISQENWRNCVWILTGWEI